MLHMSRRHGELKAASLIYSHMSNLPALFLTDYELPNADDFFSVLKDTNASSNDNEGNYRRDIFLLSTLLKGIRYRQSRTASEKTLKTLGLWFYLAFLLTAGSETISGVPRAVAVTGRIEADAVKVVVFTPNNSTLGCPASSIVIEKPALLENVENLLSDSQTTE